MSKKSMIIAGIVALVVVGLAALLFLMPRSSGNSPQPPSTSTSSGSGSSTTASSSSSATTSTASSTTGTTQGQTVNTTPPSSTTPPSDAGTNGRGVSTDTLKVYPKLPAAKTTAAPGAPIAAGQPLPNLTAAPNNTISAVKTGVVQQGAQYKVVVRPLGFGPDLPFGSRIVVHVDSAQRVGIAPKKSPIDSANVLVLVDTTHKGTITTGGTYTATITFLSDGTKLLPVITLVASK